MSNEISIPIEVIINKIYEIRDQKVMLDRDLAELYGVDTKVLKQAVRRNINRFPEDFMFEMNQQEFENWRSQFVTSKEDKQGLRYAPFCFTEQGVTMLSCVLKSDRAIEVNIKVIRVFVQLRKMIMTHKDLIIKVENIERQMDGQGHEIKVLFDYIKRLIEDKEETEAQQSRKRIGYKKDVE
jgi:ORF6N domain